MTKIVYIGSDGCMRHDTALLKPGDVIEVEDLEVADFIMTRAFELPAAELAPAKPVTDSEKE